MGARTLALDPNQYESAFSSFSLLCLKNKRKEAVKLYPSTSLKGTHRNSSASLAAIACPPVT